jgi:hypothetical protein
MGEQVIFSQHNCNEKEVLMKLFVLKLTLTIVSLFCQYVWLYVREVLQVGEKDCKNEPQWKVC